MEEIIFREMKGEANNIIYFVGIRHRQMITESYIRDNYFTKGTLSVEKTYMNFDDAKYDMRYGAYDTDDSDYRVIGYDVNKDLLFFVSYDGERKPF